MEKKRDSFFLAEKYQKKHENKKNFNENKQKSDIKAKRQENFDNNRNGVNAADTTEGKKPFDKKTYRLKKYSKKYKLEQWEEQRKKKMMHQYQKDLKKDPMAGSYKPKVFDEDNVDSNGEVGRFVKHPDLISKEESSKAVAIKKDPFKKAKDQFNKAKQDKLQKQQEREKAKEEQRQKLQEYKKKKNERFKKLSKKTKKGQPVMTGRLELLLEKIQGSK